MEALSWWSSVPLLFIWFASGFEDDVSVVILEERNFVADVRLVFAPLLPHLFDELDFVSLLNGADVQDVFAHRILWTAIRFMSGVIGVKGLFSSSSSKSSNALGQ